MSCEVANLRKLFLQAGLACSLFFALGFAVAWYLHGKAGK